MGVSLGSSLSQVAASIATTKEVDNKRTLINCEMNHQSDTIEHIHLIYHLILTMRRNRAPKRLLLPRRKKYKRCINVKRKLHLKWRV
jgi:hypothetical protein